MDNNNVGMTSERDERVVVVGVMHNDDGTESVLMTVAQHEALRAADRAEIERLLVDSQSDAMVIEQITMERDAASSERDAALAKLAEMEKQEPVGWLVEPLVCVRGDGREDYGRATFATGQPPTTDRSTPLYAQPRPAAVVRQHSGTAGIYAAFSDWIVAKSADAKARALDSLIDALDQYFHADEYPTADADEVTRLNAAAQVPEAGGVQVVPSVDQLAEIIRNVDGRHSLGAGALAERILEELDLLRQPTAQQVPEDVRRDAERYRFLRLRGDGFQWSNILRFDVEDYPGLDDAIDAALSAQSNEKEGE